MTIAATLAASGNQKTSSQTFSLSPSGAITAGSNVCVVVAYMAAINATCSDSKGNSYTRNVSAGTGTRVLIFTAENITALSTSDTVTVDLGSGNTSTPWAMEVIGITGAVSSGSLDAASTNSATGSSASPTVTSAGTPAQDHELFVGAIGIVGPSGDTFTEDTGDGWTQLSRTGTTGSTANTNITLNVATQIPTTAATKTYAPTLGTSRAFADVVVSYKKAPIALAASAADSSSAAGALTTQIKLAASASDSSGASGALTTHIKLAAAAADSSSAGGALSTQIELAASAADSSSDGGALSTHIELAASASDSSSASGALSTQIELAASPSDSSVSTGALTTQIQLAASAADASSAGGELTTQIVLIADAQGSASASGVLSNVVYLVGDPDYRVTVPARSFAVAIASRTFTVTAP